MPLSYKILLVLLPCFLLVLLPPNAICFSSLTFFCTNVSLKIQVMKKSLLVLFAVAFAMGAFAQTPNIITETPEGEFHSFTRNTYYVYWDMQWTARLTDGEINVVTNGDMAYIQNPLYYCHLNNTWVYGSYDAATGIITVPTGQYLSWYPYDNYGEMLMWGETYIYEAKGEREYYLGDTIYSNIESIQFQLRDNNLYLLGAVGEVEAEYPFFYNTIGMCASYDDDVFLLACETVLSEGQPIGIGGGTFNSAVPANPTADEWHDCGDESGQSYFAFTLPSTDVNGDPLDMHNVSYRIYTDDDQVFTFDAETYCLDIFENITEVPYWLWSDGLDFGEGKVFFYRTNMGSNPLFTWRIGIQVVYTMGGETNVSDIIYLDPNAANETFANKTVANVRYYIVTGQEMQQPKGLTIEVTTYTDGTRKVVKVLK